MNEFLSSMLWPFLACLVLVGIHAYLGIHVIARKVIFVDLALAQIAALGATFGVFLGFSFHEDTLWVKCISVIFTLLGATVFSLTRSIKETVPHEAIIGIIYAAALSLTVLVTTNLAHGDEEVRQMLAGSILWVEPRAVWSTALLYAGVGLIHFFFRHQFFALSDERTLQEKSPRFIRFWDFCFYATFGLVVTSSVNIGGVLLVFGFLVIPSVIGITLAKTLRARLLIGWGIGVLVSLAGVVASYYLDLPSGPTIVVGMAIILLLVSLGAQFANKRSRSQGLTHLFFVVLIVAVVGSLYGMRHFILPHEKESKGLVHESVSDASMLQTMLSDISPEKRIQGLKEVARQRAAAFLPEVRNLLADPDDAVREAAISTLRTFKDPKSLKALTRRASQEKDEYLKISLSEAFIELGHLAGLYILLDLMKTSKAEMVRQEAFEHFTAHVEPRFSFDATLEPPKNQAQIAVMENYLQKNSHELHFRPEHHQFRVK